MIRVRLSTEAVVFKSLKTLLSPQHNVKKNDATVLTRLLCMSGRRA